jgi:hypothetical protein
VTINNDKLFVKMPVFVKERLNAVLQSNRYNTYEIVITAIKLKEFYEQFQQNDQIKNE